jgi:hypothetical protein
MNHTLKYLTLLLVGATLASAETKPTKEAGKAAPASQAAGTTGAATAVGAKPAAAKPNPDGNLTEVKYGVKPIEPADDDGQGEGFFQTKVAFILLLVLVLMVVVALGFLLFNRKKPSAQAQAYISSGHPSAGSSAELQQISQSIQSLNVRLQNIVAGQTSIASNITSLGTSLAPKLAEAAVTALTNSDLGKARQKVASLESDLAAAQAAVKQATDERARLSEESLSLKGQLDQALREKRMAEEKVIAAEATASRQQSELEAKAALITHAQAEAANERNAAEQLRANANMGYEVLAPAKLKVTDLGAQMLEMYQASLSGEVTAIAAWSALTTFASAQADPAAKDFQLQIVRRLGVVLVGYWKHQSLSEKDRHEKLSQWAKRLNEHADSRFNLLVPALGEPIDKTRMTCATSSTAIREVLCWQVRNPSGASFSLAEVA